MIVEELIQRVQSLYSRGVQSDDSRLSSRHIYNKLLTVRSKLIAREAKQNKTISHWNYTVLPCIEMEKAPIHECPCLPEIGCKILKSVHEIPEVMVNKSRHVINYVTSLDGSIVYDYSTWREQKYKKGNKYTAKKPNYWFRDGYLYTMYRNGPKVLTMEFLAEDPITAEDFPSYCPGVEDVVEECKSPLETDFPIDIDMVDTLIELSVQELISVFRLNVEDLTNTTSDSNANNSQDSK